MSKQKEKHDSPDGMAILNEVVQHIDERVASALARPSGFVDDPFFLEEMLMVYDDVRHQIMIRLDPRQRGKEYCNYLMQTECEAATFCHRKKLNQQEVKFDEFCDFFRGFIRWRDNVS